METKLADSKDLQRFSYLPQNQNQTHRKQEQEQRQNQNKNQNEASLNDPVDTSPPPIPAEEEQENFFLQNPFTYRTPKQRWLDALAATAVEDALAAERYEAEGVEREREREREKRSLEFDSEDVVMNGRIGEAGVLMSERPTLGRVRGEEGGGVADGDGDGMCGFGKTAIRIWHICGVGLVGGGVCGGTLECEECAGKWVKEDGDGRRMEREMRK